MKERSQRVFFYPYDDASGGANELRKATGFPRIKHENSKFIGKPWKTVINWGSHQLPPEVLKCRVINPVEKLIPASEKISFFETQRRAGPEGARVPDFTTTVEAALRWIKEKKEVVGRLTTKGKGGDGIVFFDKPDRFARCRLWTVYIPKKEEYRVHIAFGKVIAVQRKVLKKQDNTGKAIDPKTVDFRVRNYDNGFIFQRENINPPDDVYEQANRAHRTLGLDFAAYDVIYNEKRGEAYVLEANTAPGLEGSTITDYANAFRSLERR